ncbi:hypothetical protein GGF46_003293 [Coemansia sp. RSA 552]|nr:hypothetical protein GGF46_003293 [Coemansia sp. RSA 552]
MLDRQAAPDHSTLAALLWLPAADKALNGIPVLRRIRRAPGTIWALSSLSFFIDTFVYSLTVAMLPDVLQNSMGAPESANGIVTTMFGVGGFVGSLATGILSDRLHDRRTLQMLGSLIYLVAGLVFYFAQHYYQILLFRLINGIASGCAGALLYASLGDVYPANLLGFKVAIVYFCNDIGYTIGPICGQKLYDAQGVKGPASVVIALGIFKLLLLATAAEDSLTIRKELFHREPIMDVSIAPTPQQSINEFDSVQVAAIPPLSEKAEILSLEKADGHSSVSYTTPIQPTADRLPDAQVNLSLPRLLLRLPVIVATLSIVASLGVQGMLEGLVPLHLIDSLNRPHDGGITFVILGLVFIVTVPIVGRTIDMLIEWRGERMRYFIFLFGSLAMILAMVVMSVAHSYTVLMVGFALFAVTNLCMCVPAQSAYGDFVNAIGTDSMARGYSIAVCAWATGAMVLPPIGTALYSRYGFTVPVIAVPTIFCVISASAAMVFIVRDICLRKRHY